MTDTLNEILVECAKVRGCHPLLHRTLHQFSWFVNVVMFGPDPTLDWEIREAKSKGYLELETSLKASKEEEIQIVARFRKKVMFEYRNDNELIRFAEAYRDYCREEYAGKEEGREV